MAYFFLGHGIGILLKHGLFSQDSVEILFRQGRKYLKHFVANSFRILCTKFYQNRPSFIEDISQTFWLTFFLGHGVLPRRFAGGNKVINR